MPKDCLEERLKQLDMRLAAVPEATQPPRTTLDILNRNRRERHWHDLLVYFIDPQEPHGFGADVLGRFLQVVSSNTEFSFSTYDLDGCEVLSEVVGSEGRPDIVIRSGREWFLLIELKVGAGEGDSQRRRYLEDERLGEIQKQEFPDEGHHYVYLSGRDSSEDPIDGFEDIDWQDLVQAFESVLSTGRGQYPSRSEAQLADFIDTIKEGMQLTEDTYTESRQRKIELYVEYQDAIEEARQAFETSIEAEQDRWFERFPTEFTPESWSEEWHCSSPAGHIYRDGWRLDQNLDPTTSSSEAVALQFVHHLRDTDLVRDGRLRFQLRWDGKADTETRDRFRAWFNDAVDSSTLDLDDKGISLEKRASVFTEKSYDFEVGRFPTSYYETLRTAFEEHQVIAEFLERREAIGEIVSR